MKLPFIKGLNLQEKNEILEMNYRSSLRDLLSVDEPYYKQFVPTGQYQQIAMWEQFVIDEIKNIQEALLIIRLKSSVGAKCL